MIVLMRLRWTQHDFDQFNSEFIDSSQLEAGWSSFIENVLQWHKIEGVFSRKAAKKAVQKRYFNAILDLLRAECDYLEGRTGRTRTNPACKLMLTQPTRWQPVGPM